MSRTRRGRAQLNRYVRASTRQELAAVHARFRRPRRGEKRDAPVFMSPWWTPDAPPLVVLAERWVTVRTDGEGVWVYREPALVVDRATYGRVVASRPQSLPPLARGKLIRVRNRTSKRA